MSFSVVIPARYASSRFPGKPLADLAGKPMLQHVYERACESEAVRVIIATDDERIANVAQNFGAEVCMTSDRQIVTVATQVHFFGDRFFRTTRVHESS